MSLVKPATCEYCFARPAVCELLVNTRWIKCCLPCEERLRAMIDRHPVEKG